MTKVGQYPLRVLNMSLLSESDLDILQEVEMDLETSNIFFTLRNLGYHFGYHEINVTLYSRKISFVLNNKQSSELLWNDKKMLLAFTYFRNMLPLRLLRFTVSPIPRSSPRTSQLRGTDVIRRHSIRKQNWYKCYRNKV